MPSTLPTRHNARTSVNRQSRIQSLGCRFRAPIASVIRVIAVFMPLAAGMPALAQVCPPEVPVNTMARSAPIGNNMSFSIDGLGGTQTVLLFWDDVPMVDTSPADGVPDLGNQVVEAIEQSMRNLDALGFRLPRGSTHRCTGPNTLRVYLYATPGTPGGRASGDRFDVYDRIGNFGASLTDNQRNTIHHEYFHLVQGEYDLGTAFTQWVLEGQAVVAPDVLDAGIDDNPANSGCRQLWMRAPETNLFMRGSPFAQGTNICHTAVLWRYLSEQLGQRLEEPIAGFDFVHDFLEYLSRKRADEPQWRSAETDVVHGAGDFDGDGQQELLVTSPTHIGLIASTSAGHRVLDVRAFGAMVSPGWRPSTEDRILGIGDFDDDGRDDILIAAPEYLVVAGTLGDGRLRAFTSTPWSDRRDTEAPSPADNDTFIGIGDFDRDGHDDALFASATHLRVVSLDDERRQIVRRTLAPLDSLAALLGRAPATVKVVALDDFDGDGITDVMMQDRQGIFAWTVAEGSFLRLVFAVDYGTRLGDGWVVNAHDVFTSASGPYRHALQPAGRSGARAPYLVVRSPRYLGLLRFADGNWQTHRVVLAGNEIDEGFRFEQNTEVMGLWRGGTAADKHRLFLRNRTSMAVIDVDTFKVTGSYLFGNQSRYGLNGHMPLEFADGDGRAGPFRVQGLPWEASNQRPLLAALAGYGVPYLVFPSTDRRRYYGHTNAAGLALATRDIHGQYLRDAERGLSAFLQQHARTKPNPAGIVNLHDAWLALTTAFATKDLAGPDAPFREIRDERAPGPVTDADNDTSTPPVASVALGPGDADPVDGLLRAWSAQYFHVPPTDAGRNVSVSIEPRSDHAPNGDRVHAEPVERPMAVRIWVVENGRIIDQVRAIVATSDWTRSFALAPTQSLRIALTGLSRELVYRRQIVLR